MEMTELLTSKSSLNTSTRMAEKPECSQPLPPGLANNAGSVLLESKVKWTACMFCIEEGKGHVAEAVPRSPMAPWVRSLLLVLTGSMGSHSNEGTDGSSGVTYILFHSNVLTHRVSTPLGSAALLQAALP